MNKHDTLQEVGLDHIRGLLMGNPVLYHYTTEDRIESIKKNGLLVGSNPQTTEGNLKGIYFTSDDRMNYLATMRDSKSKDVKVFRIEVDVSPFLDSIFIDDEFHSFCENTEDFLGELDELDGIIMAYCKSNIEPKWFTSIVEITGSMVRSNSFYSEFQE